MSDDAKTFDRFTERARKVLDHAQEEARRLNHHYLGTEHILLGLVRERDGVAAKVLAELGVDLARVRKDVEFIIGKGGPEPYTGDVGLTPRAKMVLLLANGEATRLSHNYVGTEHLLLALLQEGDGVGAQIVRGMGISKEIVFSQVMGILSIGQRPSEPSWAKDNVVTCRVDDRDLDAIDALIEAGLRSTRSEAASWLLRAGIEANRDLFEKVYTAVAEIRRLRKDVFIESMKSQVAKAATVKVAEPSGQLAPEPETAAAAPSPPGEGKTG